VSEKLWAWQTELRWVVPLVPPRVRPWVQKTVPLSEMRLGSLLDWQSVPPWA
jgi:hypothetical protein